MIKPPRIQQKILAFTLTAILLQACMQVRVDAPSALPTPRDIETVAIEDQPTATLTASPVPVTATATSTSIPPTETPIPNVTIHAVKGNLFIRRGPDMAFNPISVLYKDTGTKVIARDVLSKWVKVVIPDSDKTGWISLQTQYSQVDGDIQSLPELAPTEWPVPAYLRNCTRHQMYILPAEIVLPSSLEQPENMIWLNPGTYTAYDMDIAGEPEAATVVLSEGSIVEILYDGTGEHRKCP